MVDKLGTNAKRVDATFYSEASSNLWGNHHEIWFPGIIGRYLQPMTQNAASPHTLPSSAVKELYKRIYNVQIQLAAI